MATSRKRAGRSGKRPASGAAHTRSESQFMPEMSADEVAFIHAIADAPDDDTPRLVYADWLDEHDRPERAEFIRIQCELARCPDPTGTPTELWQCERDLLDVWGYRWLLDLHVPRGHMGLTYQSTTSPDQLHDAPARHVLASGGSYRAPLFERGFVTRLSPDKTSFYVRNRGWLRSPLLRLVTHIDMHYSMIRDSDVELLAASTNVSGVRRLALFANAIGDRGAAALAAAPNLTGLTYLALFNNRIGSAGAIALAHSDALPRLDTLLLATNRIDDSGGRAFLATRLPSLKCLTLDNNPVSDSVADELESLADTIGGFRVQFSSG